MSNRYQAAINKVAVIMSVYRSDNYLDLNTAIKSILNQSYLEIELFIYQDGPVPKEIKDVLRCYDDHHRVSIVRNSTNNGLAKALNSLISKVLSTKKFSYVARMDSDDVSRESRIEKQVSFLERNENVDICGTSCKEFGASFALEEKHLPKSHEELYNFSIVRCPFIHPSVMFRISIFNDGLRYPTNTALTEDMALWYELLVKGYRFANLNEILLDYRLNENTINRRKGISKAFSEIRIRVFYMCKLKKLSFKNIILIFSRLFFHLMPSGLIKLCYKYIR